MKNFLLLTALLLFLNKLSAQDGNAINLFQAELDKMVNMPNSPEATAFTKSGNIEVSMYTGRPDIGIPLHVIKGRELDVPMSLSYDASGIKVEQLASWAGLSWNLSIGGRINRLTNGLADDYLSGNYHTTNDGDITKRNKIVTDMNSYLENTSKVFSSETEVRDYLKFLNDINKNFVDTQPDIYRVVAPGLSTDIVFDLNDNYKPKSLDNPRIKVDQVYRGNRGNSEIVGWVITHENGSTYHFGVGGNTSDAAPKYEKTLRFGNDYVNPYANPSNQELSGIIVNEFIGSWVLTKIESPNKKDIYEFDYYDTGYWLQQLTTSAVSLSNIKLRPNVTNYTINEVTEQYGGGGEFFLSQMFLTKVKHNGHIIAEINRGFRNDIPFKDNVQARLDHMLIYDYNASLLKRIDFNNDTYFNQNTSTHTDRKLKLDKVIIKDKNEDAVQEYALEYDRPNDLPPRWTKGQDFAGFYNGKDNNQTLFPKYEFEGITFEGADRKPNGNYAKIGTLKKITYPTGGYTEFDFESNYSTFVTQDDLNVEYVNELYSQVSVSSGTDPNTPCGICCQDRYGNPPKVVSQVFDIEKAGTYNLDYVNSGIGNNGHEAYLIRRSNTVISGPLTLSPLAYDEIVDPTTCYINDDTIWTKNDGRIGSIYLTPGLYQTTVVASDITPTSVSLEVWRSEPTTTGTQGSSALMERPGIRIKTTKSYDADGIFAFGKSYSYLQAKYNFNPELVRKVKIGEATFLNRTTSYPQSEMPIVSYPKVRESIIDESLNEAGSTTYTFYDEYKGMIPQLDPPYASDYFPSIKGGQLKSRAFADASNIISRDSTEYYETVDRPISIKGMLVKVNTENLSKYPYIRDNNGEFGYDLTEAFQCPEGGGGTQETKWSTVTRPRSGFASNLGLCEPLPCLSDNFADCDPYIAIMDQVYGSLDIVETFINGAYGGVTVTKETLNAKDGTEITAVTSISETVYDKTENGLYRPIETKTVNSKGEIYRQTLTFPVENDSEFSTLFNNNRLMELVSSKTEKLDPNGNVLEFISTRKNEYYSSGNVILPSKVYTSKVSEDNLEERINFTYYSNGNLKESKQKNGNTTTYIWGYNNMYLVAKIENATYNQATNTGVNFATLNSLSNSDASKITELQKIRNGLTNAMVTSYTYDTGIGVTSVTDPRGYTINYSYDEFNRLETVKDAEGNLVTDYEYNYKNQQ